MASTITIRRSSDAVRSDFAARKRHQLTWPSKLCASTALAALLAPSAVPAGAAEDDRVSLAAGEADTLVFRMVRASGAEDAGCLRNTRTQTRST